MERENQKKIMAMEDQLSNLPYPILIHILSLLPDNREVVRTSVLSKQWRFLWKSVPLSLHFSSNNCENGQDFLDFMASIDRELHYLRSFQRIPKFKVVFTYKERYTKNIDLWVYFTAHVGNVEDFTLILYSKYEFPKFVYKSTLLRNMVLCNCKLNPSGSINWSSLVSLSIGYVNSKDDFMEEVLSGCPNLECLEIDAVWGTHHLEINSEKLKKLIIKNYVTEGEHVENYHLLEIFAPNIQNFQLLGFCHEICLSIRNVASLINAILGFTKSAGQDNLEDVCVDTSRNFFTVLLMSRILNWDLGAFRCIREKGKCH